MQSAAPGSRWIRPVMARERGVRRHQSRKRISYFAREAAARRRRDAEPVSRHWLTLSFRDGAIAGMFAAHYNRFVRPKVRATAGAQVLVDLGVGLLAVADPALSHVPEWRARAIGVSPQLALAACAAASAALALALAAVPACRRAAPLQGLLCATYTARAALWATAVGVAATAVGGPAETFSTGGPHALFAPHAAFALLIAFALHFSGMRHRAALVVVVSGLAMLTAAYATAYVTAPPAERLGAPALAAWALCMPLPLILTAWALVVTARASERRVQDEFLVRLAIGQDRKRADNVLMRMLPRPIIQQLEQGASSAAELCEVHFPTSSPPRRKRFFIMRAKREPRHVHCTRTLRGTSPCILICTHLHMHSHTRPHSHARTHARTRKRIYTQPAPPHAPTHLHTCIHVHAYVHVHTHTHSSHLTPYFPGEPLTRPLCTPPAGPVVRRVLRHVRAHCELR